MTNTPAGDTTDPSQAFPKGDSGATTSNQQNQLLSSLDIALKKISETDEKKSKTSQQELEDLNNYIKEQSKNVGNLEGLVIKSNKQAQTSTTNFNETSQKLLKKLDETITILNRQIGFKNTEENKGKNVTQLSEYDLQKLNIEKKYEEYKKDTGLFGQLLPTFTGKLIDSFQKQELDKLKKIYPEEAEAETKKKQENGNVVAADIEPESNIKGTAKAPDIKTGIQEKNNLKVEITKINEKVLDDLKKILGKPVIKNIDDEKFEEEGKGQQPAEVTVRTNKPATKPLEDKSVDGEKGKLVEPAKKEIKQDETGRWRDASGKFVKAPESVPAKKTTQVAGETIKTAAAKTAGKAAVETAGKVTGKTLLKRIPVLGLIAGGLLGAQRAMAGDLTGAGLEIASGASSLLDLVAPGAGLATGLTLDAAIAGRDIYKATNTAEPAGTINNVTAPEATTSNTSNIAANAPMTAPAKVPEQENVKSAAPLTNAANVPAPTEPSVKPATTIVATESKPISTVATLPVAEKETKVTSELPPELLQRLDSLIMILSSDKEKETSLNNMSNNSSSTTIVNNTTMGGEDNITSMRLKTLQYVNSRRQLS